MSSASRRNWPPCRTWWKRRRNRRRTAGRYDGSHPAFLSVSMTSFQLQAYVGEERLLSRVAALENQLVQAGKSWGDDKIREEFSKLQVTTHDSLK